MIDENIRGEVSGENHTGARVAGSAGVVAKLDALVGRVRGQVYLPDAAGYGTEREGFQTAARHRPDVIVGATGAEDVSAAVRFAASCGLPVAVQGTGHALLSVAGEGGVLITTHRMSGVRVDAVAKTAWIEAGVRWEQAIEEAAPYRLAPLSGSAPTVGAISYTLGGGLGLLSRQYGYAADHVRSIEVVTADGCLRHVTAESDPDLFWALLGGRDNYGVVTGMEIDLVPVSRLWGGGLFFDGGMATDVLDAYREWTSTVPDELTSSVGMIPFPDIEAVPEPLRGRYVVHVRIAYTDGAEAGEKLVAPLRAVGPRLIDTLVEMPFTESGSIHNEPVAPHSYSADNAMLRDFDTSAARTILDLAGPDAPIPCVVQLRHLGGALARPPSAPNSVGHRDAEYLLGILSPLEGFDIDTVRSVHQRLMEELAPLTIGRCLNYMYGEKPTAGQVRSAYEVGDYRRLTELKVVYDPDNMFRLNHNIPPDHRVSDRMSGTEGAA
ncbi:MAG: FAD-binding oxidoreductase [Rubrobacteraceae bacterium]